MRFIKHRLLHWYWLIIKNLRQRELCCESLGKLRYRENNITIKNKNQEQVKKKHSLEWVSKKITYSLSQKITVGFYKKECTTNWHLFFLKLTFPNELKQLFLEVVEHNTKYALFLIKNFMFSHKITKIDQL